MSVVSDIRRNVEQDVPLPEGAKLLSDGNAVLVHCVAPKAEVEAPAAAALANEPEIIKKEKKTEEEAE
jgi:hypothetical protein